MSNSDIDFKNAIPEVVEEKTFTVGGVELRCAVLDNGQRIIMEESVNAFFEALNGGDFRASPEELQAFHEWKTGGENIQ